MKKDEALRALEVAVNLPESEGGMVHASVEVVKAVLQENARLRDAVQIMNDENVVLNEAMESVIHALRHFIPDYPLTDDD